MGVHGMAKLVSLSPRGSTVRKISELRGYRIAFDALQQVYKYNIGAKGSDHDTVTSEGRITAHLRGIWFRASSLLELGITPSYVFDGAPPDGKRDTLMERRKKRDTARRRLEDNEYESELEKAKLLKRSYTLSSQELKDMSNMLRLMGISVIQAPGEAELQCASLNIAGKVDAVVSNDWDTIACGTEITFRDFGNYNGQKGTTLEVNLKLVLEDLGLSHKQFIEICTILGTDYCPGIKGIGAETTYRKYKEVGSMEPFLELLRRENIAHCNKITLENIGLISAGKPLKQYKQKYDISEEFLNSWHAASEYYLTTAVYDPSEMDVSWKKPASVQLRALLVNTFEFEQKIVDDRLSRLNSTYVKRNSDEKKERERNESRPVHNADLRSIVGKQYFSVEDFFQDVLKYQQMALVEKNRKMKSSNKRRNSQHKTKLRLGGSAGVLSVS
jgi:flap endonuclease-1